MPRCAPAGAAANGKKPAGFLPFAILPSRGFLAVSLGALAHVYAYRRA
ncbi:hypothetical protein C7S16_2207 [Burkholderia thailandensis]|uniref:Uncharacterized protein n=1 Tax=Burkholderia thailandensis TaxID=57975 RepID=A0AAW9D185_BURTH|nr:hypothetical protein [Burkholderia thailandensis]MDW9256122.1 hypothetical protein [Burkholderia thailandensis]